MVLGTSCTMLSKVPKYRDLEGSPHINIFEDETEHLLSSILWRPATCQATLANCLEGPPLVNQTFYTKLPSNLASCEDSANLTYPDFSNISRNDLTVYDIPLQGQFCKLRFPVGDHEEAASSYNVRQCNIKEGFCGLAACSYPYGNAVLTFWLYFTVKTFVRITMNTTYSLLAVQIMAFVEKYKGDYSLVIVAESIGCTLGPLIAGKLVWSSSDPYSKFKNTFSAHITVTSFHF